MDESFFWEGNVFNDDRADFKTKNQQLPAEARFFLFRGGGPLPCLAFQGLVQLEGASPPAKKEQSMQGQVTEEGLDRETVAQFVKQASHLVFIFLIEVRQGPHPGAAREWGREEAVQLRHGGQAPPIPQRPQVPTLRRQGAVVVKHMTQEPVPPQCRP
jgi:hypothetical protein